MRADKLPLKSKKSTQGKLSKSDPEFYSKIAQMAGEKLRKKYGKNYFSDLARKSHPRKEYNGGRPKKNAGKQDNQASLKQNAPSR